MSDNNNSVRSGYDIRTDLLGMAIGILESQKQALVENEHMKPDGQQSPIEPYSAEEVMDTAEKLYSFVQRKA